MFELNYNFGCFKDKILNLIVENKENYVEMIFFVKFRF